MTVAFQSAGDHNAVRSILELRTEPWDRPAAQRRTLRGTPDEVAAVVRAYAEAGATDLIVDSYTSDLARARDDMARFREEILPALG